MPSLCIIPARAPTFYLDGVAYYPKNASVVFATDVQVAAIAPEVVPAVSRKAFPRRDISPKKRFAVLKRDGFRCSYCGAKAQDVELHIDHVMPVCKGGTNDIENLTTACAECNIGKGVE